MKIETIKEDLLGALALVERVAAKHLTLPVLGCVLFSVSQAGARVRTTNLEVGIEAPLKARVLHDGVVAVPAALLSSTISLLPSRARVSLECTDTLLSIEAQGSTTNLKTLSPEEFPSLPEVGNGSSVTLRARDVLAAIRSVSYCASLSPIKPELASVFFHLDGEALITAATDSFRLAEKKLSHRPGGSFGPLLIPARSASDLCRALESVGERVTLQSDSHQLAVQADEVYFTTRLVEGSYPDYEQIIPKAYTTTATLLKQDVVLALRKAAMFSDKFRKIVISVDPKHKQCMITSQHADLGETREELTGALEGEPLTLSFNERYLADCFQSIPDDSVTLSFAGPAKPLVIRGAGNSSFRYLAMPMNR